MPSQGKRTARFLADEVNPSIAVDGSGHFVVAWNGNGGHPAPNNPTSLNAVTNTDPNGVFYQEYNWNGAGAATTNGTETLANVTVTGVQQFPAVAMTPDGVWLWAGKARAWAIRRGSFTTATRQPTIRSARRWPRWTRPPIRSSPPVALSRRPSIICVTFDEPMDSATSGQIGWADSVLNPANYELLQQNAIVTGAVTPVAYGLNEAYTWASTQPLATAQTLGLSAKYPLPTNKYEVVLQVNGTAFDPPTNGLTTAGLGAQWMPPAGPQYQLVVEATVEDKFGNHINATPAASAGSNYVLPFTVLPPNSTTTIRSAICPPTTTRRSRLPPTPTATT